jgi:hypothetical protein
MADLKVFEQIDANLKKLEIDEITEQLRPLIKGMAVESPIFDPGTFLYRARKIGATFNKATGIKYNDLIYPPKHLAKLGRLNRDGQSVFYCSMHKESVFFELQDLHAGDELILTFWQTAATMFVNNIGYTEYIFRRLGAKRECPQWRPPGIGSASNKAVVSLSRISQADLNFILSPDQNRDLRQALSERFMCSVGPTETYKYKLTTAIGELHHGTIMDQARQFSGILYPSTRMWANSDNLALLSWYADKHIRFKKASHIRIDSREHTRFSITTLDTATEFTEDGRLVWLGRLPNWTLQPGRTARFVVTPGVDKDGDYSTSQDGLPCHWVATDRNTGQVLELQ